MVNFKEDEQLNTLNHSCAHVMAQAVKHLYSNAKFWVGPVVAEGFYYDIDLGEDVIRDEDIEKITKEMKKIVKSGKKIIRREVSKEEALEMFKDDPYKLDLIGDLEDGNITVYDQGDFTDLCRGPHVDNVKLCRYFKLIRHFCQNDTHLFVTPEQIEDEFTKVVNLIFDTYKDFGITNYRCVLSLRDPENKEKYHDDDEMWNNAEDALRKVLNDIGIEYTEEIGEAAFYGPKLDVNVQPDIGNEITLSTCQLDFCLPAKFKLSYIDSNGDKKTPVVLHRAILGSLDRFMAYILEETKGNLPTWLAPVQVRVIPVKTDDDELNAYAQEIVDALEEADVRVELDDRNEKLGYRMRDGQVQKVPYLLVIGFNEKDGRTVSFRLHGEKETNVLPMNEFVEKIKQEIGEKSREHIHLN